MCITKLPGDFIALGTSTGDVEIINCRTAQRQHEHLGTEAVQSITVSPYGNLICKTKQAEVTLVFPYPDLKQEARQRMTLR